jgi:hypothetical protein
MSPILQALVTLTIRILLRLLLLRQMPLAVRHDLPHMINIVLIVLAWILLGILLQNRNDLAAGIVADGLAAAVVFGPSGSGGIFAAEPVLKLLGGHVHEFVELSRRGSWFGSRVSGLDLLDHSFIVFDHFCWSDEGAVYTI